MFISGVAVNCQERNPGAATERLASKTHPGIGAYGCDVPGLANAKSNYQSNGDVAEVYRTESDGLASSMAQRLCRKDQAAVTGFFEIDEIAHEIVPVIAVSTSLFDSASSRPDESRKHWIYVRSIRLREPVNEDARELYVARYQVRVFVSNSDKRTNTR